MQIIENECAKNKPYDTGETEGLGADIGACWSMLRHVRPRDLAECRLMLRTAAMESGPGNSCMESCP